MLEIVSGGLSTKAIQGRAFEMVLKISLLV